MISFSTSMPASPAPVPQVPDLGRASLLALDLGTTTGWAMAPPDGGIVSGTVSFRPSRYDGGGIRYLRFRLWLDSVAEDTGCIAAVYYEEEFTSFPDACVWADHPRKRAPEHFVNLPRDAKGLSTSCGEEPACVTSAIDKDFEVLSSSASSDNDKTASLKYLGHWVGDIHQPLHVSFKDDRGGNSIKTSGECGSGNLHSAWDTCLVSAAVGSDPRVAAFDLLKSIARAQSQAWTQSIPREWANESFKITQSAQTRYCELHDQSCEPSLGIVKIDQSYIRANVPVVREQFQKAGVRLAYLLDQALGK